jgi:hypothetical protein
VVVFAILFILLITSMCFALSLGNHARKNKQIGGTIGPTLAIIGFFMLVAKGIIINYHSVLKYWL